MYSIPELRRRVLRPLATREVPGPRNPPVEDQGRGREGGDTGCATEGILAVTRSVTKPRRIPHDVMLPRTA